MLETQAHVALEALAALPVGVFLVDDEDRIRHANPTAHALLDLPPGELEGLALVALTGGQAVPLTAAHRCPRWMPRDWTSIPGCSTAGTCSRS